MRHGEHLLEQPRQEGGAVYTELRREVLRCQRGGAEAFKRIERAGRDVRIMGRDLGRGWRTAETSCRRPLY